MTLTVGSLFSGIGGLDLGLERAGMTVRWQSEIDPYACRVLAKHWPNVPNLGDIKTIDWSTVENVDLICGGYPCQPFSTAGRRLGEDDPRHLWPRVADCLRALRPRYALLENVSGHVTLGLAEVLADLAEIGMDAEWSIIPASWVGAPHQRNRLFILAHSNSERCERRSRFTRSAGRAESPNGRDDVADAAQLFGDGSDHHSGGGSESVLTRSYIPESRNRVSATRPDSSWWAVEPAVGRVAHGIPSRVDRLRCLGNAVVPQVAEWIGHRIVEAAA